MAGSLQDQLLKMGLSNKKKAKKIDIAKRKQAKQNRQNKTETVDKAKELAEKAIAAEKEKSRQLNAEIKRKAEKKALAAQIKQLITLNRIDREDKNNKNAGNEHALIAYNFTDAGKVKQIYVSTALQKALGLGQLAIVKHDENYELVPYPVAKKILERDSDCVIQIKQQDTAKDTKKTQEEDPYADYQIPDDLMW